jgi:hypothetical protein
VGGAARRGEAGEVAVGVIGEFGGATVRVGLAGKAPDRVAGQGGDPPERVGDGLKIAVGAVAEGQGAGFGAVALAPLTRPTPPVAVQVQRGQAGNPGLGEAARPSRTRVRVRPVGLVVTAVRSAVV